MAVPPKNRGKSTLKKIFNYFIQGIIILAPIGITAYLLYWLFDKVDGILRPYLNIPGLGFAIIIVFVILVGWVSSNYLMGSFINFFDRWLEKTPGVKFIYSSIKDFFEAFAGDKRKFNKSVLINIYANDVWIIGFVTDEELQKFELGADMIAVYVPQAYNFAGQLYLLPRERVKTVENINSGQIMKYAVTGGVADLDEDFNGAEK
ncbi:MAG: DUF502 domain-containing protein [Bacteroidota bacterium]